MQQLFETVRNTEVVNTLLANPKMAIIVVLVALVVGKVMKVAGKVFKLILTLGIAYVLVNFIIAGA